MKICIASSHRFHLLDLAIQLERLGHEVQFFSYVPPTRVESFGLSKKACRSLFVPMLPFLGIYKITNGSAISVWLINKALDLLVSLNIRRCDVFIGLGIVYLSSFKTAKKKFGATTILEWGSTHIEAQIEALREYPAFNVPAQVFINRAKAGYEIVDKIAIPSDHVANSFIRKGVAGQKLIKIPYGVDLESFHSTKLESDSYDLIMVGGWSYRKGCDLLQELCEENRWRLLHVGPIVDLEFPKSKYFVHINSVDQRELPTYYSKAKAAILLSREEGLAMVQVQAIACGLPLVCSAHTGGRDLKQFLVDKRWVIEIPVLSLENIAIAVNQALELASTQPTGIERAIDKNVASNLSWDRYGRAYSAELEDKMQQRLN